VAKIVYGVSGEGSGHSSRARPIAIHLQHEGHDVRLVSYDRGYRNLADDFDVFETEGLTIASSDNRVSLVRTFTQNIRRLPEGFEKLQQLRRTLFREFQPDCVITDYEPMTAHLAGVHDLPLITIDNQHRMRYMEIDYPPDLETEAQVTRNISRAIVPRPDVSLVTTFFFGKVLNDRTFLFPPILRPAVLERRARDDGHTLVYLTSGFETLLEQLSRFERERFVVYGYDRTETRGNLDYRPFDRERFMDDLASARAVVATAGFTLISEALFLRKPYLALPMTGQFEQQLNGYMLEKLGYGKNVRDASADAVGDFLYRLPEYTDRLRAYEATDNRAILAKLDELLADDLAGVREFHARRRS
jgi:uncharacterized protein (TIGR00661 family)